MGSSSDSKRKVIRGLQYKTAVWPAAVIEPEVPIRSCFGSRDGLVVMQVDIFVFHRQRQALSKHVISSGALAIHADVDTVVLEQISKGLAGELAGPYS